MPHLARGALSAQRLSALAPAYRPRRPTETVLYSLVREHLETFLAHARDSYAAPLPKYVESEFREYLRCGVFAHGFLRARCDSCDHDLLVAFSCKLRGACPSCAGRRMANTAAQLVDRVLPSVPVRQWVLSLPFELRALAAFDAKVLSAFARFFASAVDTHYRASAARAGVANVDRGRTGAVTFVQRFGSSLNLNVHFHTCFLDGLYTRDDAGRLVFHEATPPRREELEAVVRTVHRRTLRWLARHGHLDRTPLEERSSDRTIPSPIEACAAIATQRGTLGTLAAESSQPGKAHESGDVDLDSAVREGGAFEHDGFNLHAKVRIASDDDLGRERLCRYGARPPFSLDRLRVLPGGRVSYRIKKVGGGRSKHRIMTPLEFLARLSALVPPPRYPLVRYHGVLAPHSAWRREIVPRPPMASRTDTAGAGGKQETCGPSRRVNTAPKHGGASSRTAGHADRDGRDNQPSRSPVVAKRADAALGAVAERDRVPLTGESNGGDASMAVTNLAPNILSVRHWSRLLGGLLYATSPRLRWPELLQRTFDVDILECSKCRGRLQLVETVVESVAARQILERLGLPVDAPRLVRARDPTTLDGDEHDAA